MIDSTPTEIPDHSGPLSRAPDTALLIVDPLNDFCLGGPLEVPHADEIIPVVNQLMRHRDYALIVLIREEHPKGHISFASRHGRKPFTAADLGSGQKQMLWPDHCITGTRGAELHPLLEVGPVDETVIKGERKDVENYSGFEDDNGNDTGLTDLLREYEIKRVEIAGLATDYCVKETALHAVRAPREFQTIVLADATRAIHSEEAAYEEMRQAGIEIRHTGALSSPTQDASK